MNTPLFRKAAIGLIASVFGLGLSSCSTLGIPRAEAYTDPYQTGGQQYPTPPAVPGTGTQSTGGNGGSSVSRTPVGHNPPVSIPRVVPPGARNRYSSVNISEQLIALTFDDGPHGTNTPRLLDALARRNVKATFYVVGQNVERYPSIVRRMVAEGHEVANHTWKHDNITKLSYDEVRRDLSRTGQAITSACGARPLTFRPPYGASNEGVRAMIYKEFGYPNILWNVDPEDWKRPGGGVVTSRLVAGARPGGILLVHDIHEPSINASINAVDQLLARGFRFCTVTQLLAAESRHKRAASTQVPASQPAAATSPAPMLHPTPVVPPSVKVGTVDLGTVGGYPIIPAAPGE